LLQVAVQLKSKELFRLTDDVCAYGIRVMTKA